MFRFEESNEKLKDESEEEAKKIYREILEVSTAGNYGMPGDNQMNSAHLN